MSRDRVTSHEQDQVTCSSAIRLVLLVSVILASCVYGQSGSGETPSAPTIVTNVDEVSLDLVVRDKKNKPVLDLKPQDIAVMDRGAPVKIADLRLLNGKSGSEHLLTLVFDRMDTAGASNARRIAAKILRAIPQNGFEFSVLNIEGRLKLYQEFTADRAVLTHAITVATETAKGDPRSDSAQAEKSLMAIAKTGTDDSGSRVSADRRAAAQVVLSSLEDSQRIMQEEHSGPSLSGLLALARSQRRFPGRKVVIYFAQGLHVDAGAGGMLATIVGTASRSGVSIYTIDTNALSEQTSQGLVAAMALGNSLSMGSSRVVAPQAATGPPPPSNIGDNMVTPGMKAMASSQVDRFENQGGGPPKEPLVVLAASTGGAYIGAGENPRKPMRKLIEDLTTYYEASYVPLIENYDGQFRPVTIKAVRPGLKIVSRAGYFALPPDNGSGIRPFEAPLLKVLAEAQLPQDLKFWAGILQLGDLQGGNTNAVVVEVPISELETRDDPNTNLYSLHVSIVAQIKNKSGDVIEHFSEDVPRHGSLDSKNGTRLELITMQRHFIAGSGEYTMEAAVLDRNSGKTSAQRSTFVVSSMAVGPSLSDLTLVQQMDPFPDETGSSEPLRYGSGKVVPNLSGHISRGSSVSLFFLIHPDPQSTEQPRLEMSVMRSNEQLTQVPLQLRKVSGQGAIPYLASIQAGGLPPGDYQIVEMLTQGTKIAERSVTFRIEGGELASATTPANLANTSGTQKDDIELASVAQPQTAASDPRDARRLVITTLPAESAASPSADDLQAMVAAARKMALGYAKSLPNFICVEVTSRSVDPSGKGNWKHRDTIAELLRYADNQETRTILERNGQRTSTLQRSELDPTWLTSVGEFGALLNNVFLPSSKAEFQWKESDALGTGTLQVLSYRVARENGTIGIKGSNGTVAAGFHGLVYIDTLSGAVRRITLEADDLPRDFSIHAASMTVEYDYVAIGEHDYLMPMRAAVSLQRGRKQIDLNEITFRNYRRYASQAKITVVQ